MRYLFAYIIGNPVGIWLLNEVWYPAPIWAHGVTLGLMMGVAAIAGGVVVAASFWMAERIDAAFVHKPMEM